jgi:hypothetical protein
MKSAIPLALQRLWLAAAGFWCLGALVHGRRASLAGFLFAVCLFSPSSARAQAPLCDPTASSVDAPAEVQRANDERLEELPCDSPIYWKWLGINVGATDEEERYSPVPAERREPDFSSSDDHLLCFNVHPLGVTAELVGRVLSPAARGGPRAGAVHALERPPRAGFNS